MNQLVVALVQSPTWGADAKKKWKGSASSINDLVQGLEAKFALPKGSKLQYFDHDCQAFVDLDQDDFREFLDQVRIGFLPPSFS